MKFLLSKQSKICAEGSTSSDSTKQQDSSCQKSSLPLLRNRQEAPHHKLPDTKASKQKYRLDRQGRDSKELEPEASLKKGDWGCVF